MLNTLDAVELANWRTFELSEGPLDRSYEREMLARLVELMHVLIRTSQVNVYEDELPHIPRPGLEIDETTEEQKQEQEAAEKQAEVSALDRALGY